MKKEYKNTIQVMCQGDEGLSRIIQSFIGGFPKLLKEKLEFHKKRGIASSDDKRWVFEETGNELSISV